MKRKNGIKKIVFQYCSRTYKAGVRSNIFWLCTTSLIEELAVVGC
jgi:hypothetical protein